MYDDDDVDRALVAVPLDEPPARLPASIMPATVDRPHAMGQHWDVWTLVALAARGVVA